MSLRTAAGSLPGTRRLARKLRTLWQRAQPFPRPDYGPSTPRTGGDNAWDPCLPPTALTLGAAAMSAEAATFVTGVLERLTPSDDYAMEMFHYRWSQDRFGQYWRFADLSTTLWAAATLIRPANYLEVGVNRGRSAAVVGAVCSSVSIFGFDLWVPGYEGQPNPGPEFVRGELTAAGHQGAVTLVSGDSRRTLPAFLEQHPALFFELMTIDGDKAVRGFARDLACALPRLKVGGALVVDDLAAVPALRRVWRSVIEQDGRFATWEFTDAGYGVAIAVRAA